MMAHPVARSAWRELTYHPFRYVATLVAVAIAVGFMAAASIMTATESGAIAGQVAAPYSRADLIVTSVHCPDALTAAEMTTAIAGTPGVDATEPVVTLPMVLGRGSTSTMALVVVQPAERFRWTALKDGTWPQGAQIALNQRLSDQLGARIGDAVSVFGTDMTVSGITTQPTSRLGSDPAIIDAAWFAEGYGEMYAGQTSWVVAVAPGASADPAGPTATAIKDALTSIDVTAEVQTYPQYAAATAADTTGGIDVFKYLLWGFAGIAMVVGLITISNTFTILLTGRRRQIGLMRTIGTTGAQMRHSIWLEAATLGLTGAVLGLALACGLAALLGLYTGSIAYGLVVPWRDTAIAMALGVVITLVACVAPARRATRVPPLAALQPATADLPAARVSVVRLVVCATLFAGGVGAALYSLRAEDNAFVIAIGGAMAISIGVLFGARLFVPGLLKAVGRLVSRSGPPATAAAKNVVRDPARAAAASMALMLAVGLVVTLQVGAASMRATAFAKITQMFPVDLYVGAYLDETGRPQLPESLVRQITAIPGIGQAVPVPCRTATGDALGGTLICRYDAAVAGIAAGLPAVLADDEVLINDTWKSPAPGDTITESGLTLTATGSNLATNRVVFVSPATYDKLGGTAGSPALLLLTVPDAAQGATVMQAIDNAVGTDSRVAYAEGGLYERSLVENVLTIIVSAVTALLAVAIVIALVGVGNTLTLSVMERAHENAILRALGFTRRQIRVMLLVEALLLTLVAAVVGIVAGFFFGWLGATVMVRTFLLQGVNLSLHLAVDWGQTLLLLGVLVVAAGLASILPGRRAAHASPVEALAEVQ